LQPPSRWLRLLGAFADEDLLQRRLSSAPYGLAIT
jgi:hypothetical protein